MTWTTFLRTLIVCGLSILGGCEEQLFDTDTPGDTAAEADDTASGMPQSPPPYLQLQLTSLSGERDVVSTYGGHVAWDFNKVGTSGNGDFGEPVVAPANGRIEAQVRNCDDWSSSGCSGGAGNYVRIDLDGTDADVLLYHLCKNQPVVLNQWVEAGQTVGLRCSSGNSTAAHSHTEARDGANRAFLPTYVWDGGAGGLWSGAVVKSRNHGKFDSLRNRMGAAKLGNMKTAVASRVTAAGISAEYSGGTMGAVSVYYEALGWAGSYNNTNYAYAVSDKIRSSYHMMGGPNSWLGYPTGDQTFNGTTNRQTFRYGYMVHDIRTGKVTAYRY